MFQKIKTTAPVVHESDIQVPSKPFCTSLRRCLEEIECVDFHRSAQSFLCVFVAVYFSSSSLCGRHGGFSSKSRDPLDSVAQASIPVVYHGTNERVDGEIDFFFFSTFGVAKLTFFFNRQLQDG